jgi:hypothetical protein
MRKLLIAVATLSVCTCVQADGVVFGAGLYGTDLRNGVEIEAGYRFSFNVVGLNVMPLGINTFKKFGSRYSDENLSGGQTICYDNDYRRAVDDSKCRSDFVYVPSIALDFKLSENWRVGAGFRSIKSEATSFGFTSFRMGARDVIQIRAGENYFAIGLTNAF